MMDCEVCANIESENVIFEDADVVAYLETNAASMAHIAITTKKHYPSITQVPDYLVAWCFAISNKLSKVILESMNVQGLNLLVQAGEGAGQETDHFTLNVLPRVQNDNLPLTWTPQQADFEELKKQLEVYKKATDKRWIFEQKDGTAPTKVADEEVIKQEEGEDNYQIKQLHRLP